MNLLTTSDRLRKDSPETSRQTVIRLENVSVNYRVPRERVATLKEHAIRWVQRRLQYDDFLALEAVNLRVRCGDVVGIIGRNGAGKSTLLKVIARVLRPTRGRIIIYGRVAPLLEFGAGFHPELTGRENVFLNGALLGFSHAEMEAKFQRIVDFAEMWDFIDAPLRTYSSGMMARLGFAVATDVEPDILIVDEILAVGDYAFQAKSLERIQGFQAAGATILLVSHNLDTVRSMCDQVVWLDHGRLIAHGSAEEIVYQYLSHNMEMESKRLTGVARSLPDHRLGTRRIEITDVRLMNQQREPQTIFRTDDSLVLEMGYEAREPITSPIFGIAIHRQDGVHITGPNTSFADQTLPTVEGCGTVRFQVPSLALLEGLYFISVAVTNHSDTEIFDYHDRAYPFRVVNGNGDTKERYGLMTLRGEWEHIPGGTLSNAHRSQNSVASN